MKIKLLLTVFALIACIGCKTPQLSQSTARTTTANAVILAALFDPSVTPYMREATPVVCAAANLHTNAAPKDLVDAIDARTGPDLKTIGAVIAINSILAMYSAIYESSAWTNAQPTLQGICYGLNDALAVLNQPAPPGGLRAPAIARRTKLPPHIRPK